MSVPYIPLYVNDYEADTAHLSIAEDGAYFRLLRLCWRTPGCSIPDDTTWIRRKMRASVTEYDEVIAPIIDEFFTRRNGRVYNPRLVAEWKKVSETYRKRSNAGKMGGRPKATENIEKEVKPGLSPPKAGPKQLEPELEPDKKKGEPNGSPKKERGTRLPKGWVLPNDWGQWALSEGWAESVVRLEAEKFRDHWHSVPGQKGVKLDWLATWRNWMRNSKSPKIINGGSDGRTGKRTEQLRAFVAGAD